MFRLHKETKPMYLGSAGCVISGSQALLKKVQGTSLRR